MALKINFYLTIDDKKYLIHRTVKTTKHKDGKISNSYGIKYQSLEFEYDEEGNLLAHESPSGALTSFFYEWTSLDSSHPVKQKVTELPCKAKTIEIMNDETEDKATDEDKPMMYDLYIGAEVMMDKGEGVMLSAKIIHRTHEADGTLKDNAH